MLAGGAAAALDVFQRYRSEPAVILDSDLESVLRARKLLQESNGIALNVRERLSSEAVSPERFTDQHIPRSTLRKPQSWVLMSVSGGFTQSHILRAPLLGRRYRCSIH